MVSIDTAVDTYDGYVCFLLKVFTLCAQSDNVGSFFNPFCRNKLFLSYLNVCNLHREYQMFHKVK